MNLSEIVNGGHLPVKVFFNKGKEGVLLVRAIGKADVECIPCFEDGREIPMKDEDKFLHNYETDKSENYYFRIQESQEAAK